MNAAEREERLNFITHAAGVLMSVFGGAWLVASASLSGSARLIVGVSVFAFTLILLYSASTLYHAVRSRVARGRMKIFDHAAIYLLIAGTYTPFTLAGIRGAWGWSLFGVIWGLAAAGVVFKLFFTGRFRVVSTGIYVAMGWLILIAIVPMTRALSSDTLVWLAAGGVTYTSGTLFYLSRRRYAHAIWHVFVLGGSICHAIAVATL